MIFLSLHQTGDMFTRKLRLFNQSFPFWRVCNSINWKKKYSEIEFKLISKKKKYTVENLKKSQVSKDYTLTYPAVITWFVIMRSTSPSVFQGITYISTNCTCRRQELIILWCIYVHHLVGGNCWWQVHGGQWIARAMSEPRALHSSSRSWHDGSSCWRSPDRWGTSGEHAYVLTLIEMLYTATSVLLMFRELVSEFTTIPLWGTLTTWQLGW